MTRDVAHADSVYPYPPTVHLTSTPLIRCKVHRLSLSAIAASIIPLLWRLETKTRLGTEGITLKSLHQIDKSSLSPSFYDCLFLVIYQNLSIPVKQIRPFSASSRKLVPVNSNQGDNNPKTTADILVLNNKVLNWQVNTNSFQREDLKLSLRQNCIKLESSLEPLTFRTFRE